MPAQPVTTPGPVASATAAFPLQLADPYHRERHHELTPDAFLMPMPMPGFLAAATALTADNILGRYSYAHKDRFLSVAPGTQGYAHNAFKPQADDGAASSSGHFRTAIMKGAASPAAGWKAQPTAQRHYRSMDKMGFAGSGIPLVYPKEPQSSRCAGKKQKSKRRPLRQRAPSLWCCAVPLSQPCRVFRDKGAPFRAWWFNFLAQGP